MAGSIVEGKIPISPRVCHTHFAKLYSTGEKGREGLDNKRRNNRDSRSSEDSLEDGRKRSRAKETKSKQKGEMK